MYILFWLALLSGFLAVLCGLAAFGMSRGLGRRIAVVSCVSLIAVGLAIVVGLALAPRPICEALGGGWNRNGSAVSCLNEWGGNGDNETNAPRAAIERV